MEAAADFSSFALRSRSRCSRAARRSRSSSARAAASASAAAFALFASSAASSAALAAASEGVSVAELARPVRIAAHPLGALGGAAGSETVADSITSATSPAAATDPSFPELPFGFANPPLLLSVEAAFEAEPLFRRPPERFPLVTVSHAASSSSAATNAGVADSTGSDRLRSARRRTRLAVSAASRSRRKSTESDTPDLSVRVQRRVASASSDKARVEARFARTRAGSAPSPLFHAPLSCSMPAEVCG